VALPDWLTRGVRLGRKGRRVITSAVASVTAAERILNYKATTLDLLVGVPGMSEQSEVAVQQAVGRSCGFAALVIGSVVNALAFMPIPAIKAGGYLSLITALFLMLQAGRAEQASRAEALARRTGRVRSEPMLGTVRRKALLRYAYLFALAAAMCLATGLAGDLNLALRS
jgi:hypothetical protein